MQDIKEGQLLPIHFDLPRHVIPLRTFVETAESAGRIAEVINQELFGGTFTLEVVIIPPEEGTFLAKLGIVVTVVGIWVAQQIVAGPLSDFGSGVFAEIVSKDASDVGREMVQGVRAAFDELMSPSENQEAKCQAASVVTVAAVKWILQEDNEEIEELPVAPVLREALVAKRRFYEACKAVQDLKGVGFSRQPTFPIRRGDFQRLSQIPEGSDDDEWHVAIENITGTSPNWNRNDTARNWKGADQDGHARYFVIRDERFWEMVFRGQLSPRIADSMRVQWAYKQGPKRRKNHIVLRVLQFNGVKVSEEMTDRELRPFLDSFQRVQNDEPSFFDDPR
jgi:hypothetical protein